MSAYERKIKKIMSVERCDRDKAEQFYRLSNVLISEHYTTELGKQVYKKLEELRTV
jgi:hypothetical protein